MQKRIGEASTRRHSNSPCLNNILYSATETVIKKGKEAIISFAEGDEQRKYV